MSSSEPNQWSTHTLTDQWDRRINYLRFSVTDRCNLRCRYCVPHTGILRKPREQILRYEEITRLARVFGELGVHRLRLTGGEPLLRPHLDLLIAMIREAVPEIRDIAITTNGQLLGRQATELREAGLDRVNVSLDTLRSDRYRTITSGELGPVLRGLDAAEEAGLLPLKVNVVLVRGINEDEAVDFARFTIARSVSVRFIEFMPLADSAAQWRPESVLHESEVRRLIEERLGPLEVAATPNSSRGGEAARVPGAKGTVEFISPISKPFCRVCNRLRMSADGQLRPCLMSDEVTDLRAILRRSADDGPLRDAIMDALQRKPHGHSLEKEEPCRPATPMCAIGG